MGQYISTQLCALGQIVSLSLERVKMLVHAIFLLMTGASVCQAAGSTTHRPHNYPDIEAVLSKKPHYSMFLSLLRQAGMLDQLKSLPHMTLFAPTNAALSAIPNDEFEALKNDQLSLRALMQYHATSDMSYHTNSRSGNDKVLKSMDKGLPIRLNYYRTVHTMAAEGINITEQNIRCANGYIQGIDGVMSPPEGDVVDIINANPKTSILASLIQKSGLGPTIRSDLNITVFAPTDDAFAKLSDEALTYLSNSPNALKEVLLYHVVKQTTLYSIGMRQAMTFLTADRHKDSLMLIEDPNSDDFFLNHARVSDKDISATNGVLHLLDDVLIPTPILIQIEDQGLHLG